MASSDTGIRDWNLLSDSALWRYIVESDSTATVGIKAPGSAKGVRQRAGAGRPPELERGEGGDRCNLRTPSGQIRHVDGLISGPSSISFDGPEPGVEYGNYSVTVTGGNGPIEYSWREGTETGPTHTHTFLDPGWDYTAHVDVIIRDAGTTNQALTFRKLVYVYSASGPGTPCTPEPPAIACDP